ncbi:DENN domain and WD repeat-containing protein SCD1 [Camellia lanceoleosa]|uniref:DENN domain and WD repeat-containing protein SCD1 n=1 Tax=Camellia lanceoleosa TaxID=1840588 RepID=A0ACC0FEZ9_9ERIC|nr:DENN domain and WD repeat-containing protein SCD1 [Camellia lanceoleosa]
MAPIFEYFVVCGLGPEIRTLDGNRGFHGTLVMYLPSLLDQYPPSNHTLYPPPPPQLPTIIILYCLYSSPRNGTSLMLVSPMWSVGSSVQYTELTSGIVFAKLFPLVL